MNIDCAPFGVRCSCTFHSIPRKRPSTTRSRQRNGKSLSLHNIVIILCSRIVQRCTTILLCWFCLVAFCCFRVHFLVFGRRSPRPTYIHSTVCCVKMWRKKIVCKSFDGLVRLKWLHVLPQYVSECVCVRAERAHSIFSVAGKAKILYFCTRSGLRFLF